LITPLHFHIFRKWGVTADDVVDGYEIHRRGDAALIFWRSRLFLVMALRASQLMIRARWRDGISRNVVILGVVSLLQDVSSEMLYPVVPVFLTTVLAAPMSAVGLIEGLAEFTAALLKGFAGRWSDRLQRRRFFVSLGYGISAASRPLLPLAQTWTVILGARLLDRIGKGIRTSPRDALLADAAPPEHRGKVFGLHRALDTVGAFIGPLIAIALLSWSGNDFRLVFIAAIVPSILAVVLTFAVRETKLRSREGGSREEFSMSSLPREYWIFLWINIIFFLGNSADVFLILRAKELGLSVQGSIFAYVVYQAAFAVFATPAGILSDRWTRRRVMQVGFIIFALTYFGFAQANHSTWVWPLFCLYGFYAAMTEGVSKAAIADLVTYEHRGAAIGIFYAATGVATLIASTLAGWLWTHFGAAAAFYLSASLAVVAASLLHFWKGK
jgi:MFS family permease